MTAAELRSDLGRLSLTAASRLLDVGCGPCGPLVFAVQSTGCTGTGVDVSASAIEAGRARAAAAGVQDRVALLLADLNRPIPLAGPSFDAVICLDAVLHLRDRKAFFDEMARLLEPGGRLVLTDAAVVTGPVSNAEIERRSANGYTQFVPAGVNEGLLEAAGFRLIGREDRTDSVVLNASGRLKAMHAHRSEIEAADGSSRRPWSRCRSEGLCRDSCTSLSWRGQRCDLNHFPMQKRLKISPRTSSAVTCPVISPSASPARRNSSAASSGRSAAGCRCSAASRR